MIDVVCWSLVFVGAVLLLALRARHRSKLRSEFEQKAKSDREHLLLGQLKSQIDEAGSRFDELTRKNKEYFSLLERLEKQREEWKSMWFTQVGQHQEAQAMLERVIVSLRQHLVAAVTEINAHRKERGLPEIRSSIDLQAPPVGTASAYGVRMKELEKSAPADLDVAAETGKIETA